MRKLIFINLLAFLMLQTVFGQISPVEEMKYSPNGYFETVFDHYGNSYQLKDLLAGADVKVENTTYKTTLSVCNSGIFELYFEDNWFGNSATTAQQEARKAVICQVFHDLSDFIVTPLKDVGNTTKVKIWVRNINNLQNVPSNALGLASSFYTTHFHNSQSFGGIVDSELKKTITLGKNSYLGLTAPLSIRNGSQSVSGDFYHAIMAFNFNDFVWNTNLTIDSPVGYYDLYSVVLHEVTHTLGIVSLITSYGTSVFGSGYKYFSRYDSLLKNNSGTQNLINNNFSGATSSMYNYSVALSSSLSPDNSNCITDQTTCTTGVKFFGPSATIPVYNPNCFEQGSSLSHFEDQCIVPPNQGNNSYFVMSNAQSNGSPPNTSVNTKRFLRTEERNALSDIGYLLNSTYGNNSLVHNSYFDYQQPITIGNAVAGFNDGIDITNGYMQFTGNPGDQILINNILLNDTSSNLSNLRFEGLQDVYSNSYLSVNSGDSSTNIYFSSNTPGLHLLRYVPYDIVTGQRGNITYIFVLVNRFSECATPSANNLVINGGFEQYTSLPSGYGSQNMIYNACNWGPATFATPDYYHTNSNSFIVQVPCNSYGYEPVNNSAGNAYGGMIISIVNNLFYSEPLMTKLSSPLLPDIAYQLSFDVSLSEGSRYASKLQAFLSTNKLPEIANNTGDISIDNQNLNMLFTDDSILTNKIGWKKIIFNIPQRDSAGEEFLYLGGLKNVQMIPLAFQSQTYCGNLSLYNGWGNYYIDNVSLVPLNDLSFDLPNQICNGIILSNLNDYLTNLNFNGVFTGNGVVNNNGVFSFNSSLSGLGSHTITYAYTNNGEQIEIYANIEVVSDGIIPEFNAIAPICSGGAFTLPTTSVNFIDGSWSPAINNTATTTYTFTPNANQCGAVTTTLTVEVLPANDPSCSNNPCPADLTLSTPETNNTIVYKTENWIKANSNYEVDGENVTMKAGDYIVFETDAHLKAGSEVTAFIETCTATSRMSNNIGTTKENLVAKENTISDSILLFPNPTTDRLTITSDTEAMNSVIITAMDGKVIYSKNAINNNKLELDTSNYQGGIYMVTITTIDGTGFVKKLVKN